MPKKRRIDSEGVQSLSINDVKPASVGVAVQPLSNARVTSGNNDYVIDLAGCPTNDYIAAGTASSGAAILKLQADKLVKIAQPKLHTRELSSVRLDPENSAVLLSSGFDGVVKGWDTNSQSCTLELDARDANTSNGKPQLNCLDKRGHIVAAGSDGVITFWDDRSPSKILKQFADTHEKRVTQVLWHSNGDSFLSASEDGLVSVFTTSQGLDEDDGFQAALNLMDSVSRMGFYGKGQDKLWCTTDTQSLFTWDWQAACQEESAGGEGPSMSCTDTRRQLNPGTGEDDDLPESSMSAVLDMTEAEAGQLTVTCCAQDGAIALVPLRKKDASCKLRVKKQKAFQGGHSAAVRCALHELGSHKLFVTGGEDGRVAVWSKSTQHSGSGAKRKQ